MILPARHRRSLGSRDDENRISAGCPEFSTRSAQSVPTRRPCRIRPADRGIDLRGSTGEPPFANRRRPRLIFSGVDGLYVKRSGPDLRRSLDRPDLQPETVHRSGAADLLVSNDHFHVHNLDYLLPELTCTKSLRLQAEPKRRV